MNAFQSLLICTSILFGMSAQMLLLDIRIKSLKDTQHMFFVVSNLLVLAANISLSLVLTVEQHMRIYILVVHVPIFLIFWITTKASAIKVIFTLLTAVFLSYPANLVLTMVSSTMKQPYPLWLYIIYIAVCSLVLLIVFHFFKTNFYYLIKNYSGISFIKLCLLPLGYYIANYWLGMYNYADVMSAEVVSMRILIFVITLIAYVLILDIAKSIREKEALQGSKMALSLLLESANQQVYALKATQEQAALYRHDMRHHMALINGYLAEGDLEKAQKYVKLTQTDIENITPNRYCENNTVNLILTSFAAKAKKSGVVFSVDARLPQSVSISETELCALLSNALENAISAAAQVADEKFRNLRISCHTHKGNLLIFIENSFAGEVTMENGLPQSDREGHGLGAKSIAMIVEKNNGFCSFEVKDEIFTLRIVLPL